MTSETRQTKLPAIPSQEAIQSPSRSSGGEFRSHDHSSSGMTAAIEALGTVRFAEKKGEMLSPRCKLSYAGGGGRYGYLDPACFPSG